MSHTRQPMQPPLSAALPRRVALDGQLEPARAVELVADDSAPAVLTGRWADVTAIAASDPLWTAGPETDPLSVLDGGRDLLDEGDAIAVGGGWIGLLSYAACLRAGGIETAQPPVREHLPRHVLAYYDHVLVRDVTGRWWLEMLWRPERDHALGRRVELLRGRLAAASARPLPSPAEAPLELWTHAPARGGHARAVEACRQRIAAGDLYEANLALRLRARLSAAPAALYTTGVAALAPDRAAFLAGGWGAIVSLSPELLAARHDDRLTTAPIKGTRPNPVADPPRSRALHDELAASEKDRAENVMIVDLMRNDLGRVCVPGSVVAGPVCEVRAMAGVWQLVSEVRGRVRPGIGDSAICAALLPAGSVTGAPKQAACAVIAELESVARQAFCGSVVLASARGLELSVVIRTLECTGDEIWLDAGGAVTAGSDPRAETAECLAKAAPILTAIGARTGGPERTVAAPRPVRLAARPLPRPGPADGVFTTMRCEHGVALALEAHLARLANSVRALYGLPLPAAIEDEIRACAATTSGIARLRAHVATDGTPTVVAGPLGAIPSPLVLAPVCVPGGLGAHKLADRRLADALTAAVTPAEPLICDLGGDALETTRFALLARIGGQLRTPPADGRILPSIGARSVVAAGEAEVAPLTLEDLRSADELYVVNALRDRLPAVLAGAQVTGSQ